MLSQRHFTCQKWSSWHIINMILRIKGLASLQTSHFSMRNFLLIFCYIVHASPTLSKARTSESFFDGVEGTIKSFDSRLLNRNT